MATHMLRKACHNFLRFSTLRQQAARQISVLANRNVFSTERINSQSHSLEISRVIRQPILQVKSFSEGPALTAAELEQRTLEVIKSFDKVDPDKVTVDAHFINDMGLDSLDVVDILMAFEDEFGKICPDPLTLAKVMRGMLPLHPRKIIPIPELFFNEPGVEISDEQAEKIFTPKEAIEFMKTFLDIHDH